ncbi:TetR/AcrR family transcriptional regulator [Neobacillus sp. LXY-4]|uniref:TetR/AcrR family transcriptional regulator n=1 Tax=Neobacillus sp. LXY-4 TaxID=3379826 RepID=UPI003EE268FA
MARERKFSTEELFQATKPILLEHGYEGFTFSLLAGRMNVSRGALYKYYENKDELIIDFMIYEMEQYLLELKKIVNHASFESQFDFLFDVMFKRTEVPHLIGVAQQIPVNSNSTVRERKERLDQLHLDMYKYLQDFIDIGRKEGKLKTHIPDGLMLGIIFQSIAIPNHFGVPQSEWVRSIKEILSRGMFEIK